MVGKARCNMEHNYCCECPEKNLRDRFAKEILQSVEPCDGFVHKFSCGNKCRKYNHIINNNKGEHYCFGRRFSPKAVNWIKLVGCASFKEGIDGNIAS